MFTTMEPFKGRFTIMQVERELEVTHFGTIVLEVDGKFRKERLSIGNVLLLECMEFNIFSLQKARQGDYVYGFDAIPGKVALLRKLQMDQLISMH